MRSLVTVTTVTLIAALTGSATPAAATSARVAGLGGGSDYFTDESNVRRWYASLPGQSPLAWLEPGVLDLDAGHAGWDARVSGEGGGLFVDLGSDRAVWTGALSFCADHQDGPPGGSIAGQIGRCQGPLGVAISLLGSSFETSERASAQLATGYANYSHEIGLGLTWSVSDRMGIEVAGEIVNTQFSIRDWRVNAYREGESTWSSFGLRGRTSWRTSERWTVTPVVDYWRDIRGVCTQVFPSDADRDAWQLRIGCGVSREQTSLCRFLFSSEYRKGKEDFTGGSSTARFTDSKRDYYVLHARFGGEVEMRPWLTVRLGAEYRRVVESFMRWHSFSWNPYLDWERGGSVRVETPLSIGCSVGEGDLTLDLMLADGTPSWAGYLRSENGLTDNGHYFGATLAYRY